MSFTLKRCLHLHGLHLYLEGLMWIEPWVHKLNRSKQREFAGADRLLDLHLTDNILSDFSYITLRYSIKDIFQPHL